MAGIWQVYHRVHHMSGAMYMGCCTYMLRGTQLYIFTSKVMAYWSPLVRTLVHALQHA